MDSAYLQMSLVKNWEIMLKMMSKPGTEIAVSAFDITSPNVGRSC